jgi:hypothetical protein
MNVEKIAILLEIVGLVFEGIFAGIIFPAVIRRGRESITSFSAKVRKRVIPASPISFTALAAVVFSVASIDFMIIWGCIQGILLLFWLGIGALCLLLLIVLLNKESRDEQIPQGTSRWLFPFYILLIAFWVFIGIPVMLMPLVLLQIIIYIISYVTKLLASAEVIRWVLLVIGIVMILLGLVLEFVALE